MNGQGSQIPIANVRIQPNGDNIVAQPSDQFVCTSYVRDMSERALAYLDAGYAVHFSGPAGTGKTTLAFHVASQLGRPVSLVHGDDEFGSSDLVGRDAGYRKHTLIDNFIHSVLKTEEEMKTLWVDNRLTAACQHGYTLIYDEFTRSRPEANNALLSILSERILNLPRLREFGEGYLKVHPEFRAIFTSNPEEYAGVHKTQDALMDRLITVNVGHYDRETEIEIVMARSGISRADAETIVDIVRELRSIGVNNNRPTIRVSIAIATILAKRQAHARMDDAVFRWVCGDLLTVDTAKVTHDGEPAIVGQVSEVIRRLCKVNSSQRGQNSKERGSRNGSH
ncbi:MAG: gas vesicle protein GvpN [Acidobacteria bacterium]|nr:gas vesicle protein GvpN [Acidobacteriota bacterium]